MISVIGTGVEHGHGAVGLLPISSSAPVFISSGGLVRWLVDRRLRHKLREHELGSLQLAWGSDKSPGRDAGEWIRYAGSIIGNLPRHDGSAAQVGQQNFSLVGGTHNPFFAGANADWLALIPFVVLVGILYLAGREMFLAKPSER